MEKDEIYFENQNNKYRLNNKFGFQLKNVRSGKYHHLKEDIYDTIIDVDEENVFGIWFNEYEYVKDIPTTLSCIFEEIKKLRIFR